VIRRPVRDSGGSRLSRRDLLRVGSLGLRSWRMRAALSALGISIGIAAIVGVLGISQSSKTGLLNELGQLGNLISVQAQNTGLGQQTELPVTAEGMVSRIGPVTSVSEIGSISNVYVYRNALVPASDTSGISLTATDAALPATLGATLAHGTFLNAATAHFPAVVLGAETASLLGINDLAHPTQVWIGGHWFTVVGILNPVQLISQMDSMAFIGFPVAGQYFGFDGYPTGLYLRSLPSQVTDVVAVLPATVSPANPSIVAVSYPSDILRAALVTKGAYNGLLLGLGAVALLVGGIANVMVISVLERRSELGLRRALGATRRHVAEQFLAEAVLLAVLGGLAGTIIGTVATVIYAVSQHWSVQIPPPWPSTAVWAPPSSSALLPDCTRRCGPPASHQPKRCTRYKHPNQGQCDLPSFFLEICGPSQEATRRSGRSLSCQASNAECPFGARIHLSRLALQCDQAVTCSPRPSPAATVRDVSLGTAVRRMVLAAACAAFRRGQSQFGGRSNLVEARVALFEARCDGLRLVRAAAQCADLLLLG